MGIRGFFDWAGGTGKGLGSFGEWMPFIGDGWAKRANQIENFGQITETLADKDLALKDKAGETVESIVELTIQEKIINFVDRFTPRWLARIVGVWATNKIGDIADDLTTNLVGNFTENKSTDEPQKSAAEIARENNLRNLDLDGDGEPDSYVDATGEYISPAAGGVGKTQEQLVGANA